MERRLTAILAADVVGYSRLMGEDEAGTLERLKSLRKDLVQPRITERKGRIVKLMGDGLLAEFPSVVEAVQCAVEIQAAIPKREPDRPGNERIRLRIGVNLGDIIGEGSDIYGDGVNLAARLEGLASPGGICVSGPVFDQVKGKTDLRFADLGEQQVKNFAHPVRVYRIVVEDGSDGSKAGDTPADARPVLELRDKPSIAVLPFANMSGDPDQQYFSDGVTEDITTELCRFGSINVLARHTTFVLRDRAEDIREAIAALGADYLLEGSIRRAGNRIRLTAQLVDVDSQKQIWAHRYDREQADVFAIQDELVHAIVATLIGRLEANSLERALRKPPESLAAYDYYLQGLWYDRKYDPEYAADVRGPLERAIALDPTFARAYALLATSMMMAGWFGGSLESPSQEILRIAKTAVEQDPTDGDCFAKLGVVHIDRVEHEEARRCFERAFDLNPHDPSIWSHYAWYLLTVGEPEKALENLDRREAIDPHPPNWHLDIRAAALYDLGRYEEAAGLLEEKTAPYSYNYGQLAACYGQLGRTEEAATSWQRFVEGTPGATLADVGAANCYLRQADIDHWTEGLLKAGLPE